MGTRGYVYILANSAMPGLVKVGKTERSPSQRAEELSGSTAMPTPFIVVYEELFDDCDAAEQFVHTVLKQKGIKESSNREFFRASPRDVIQVILCTPGKSTNGLDDYESADGPEGLIDPEESDDLDEFLRDDEVSYPWSGIWEEAKKLYIGYEDAIQDYGEALERFDEAAKLGCPMAYHQIGYMYEYGQGVAKSAAKALEFYKKGVRKGDYYNYLAMAEMFTRADHQENYEKAMKLFFQARKQGINTVVENEWDFAGQLGAFIIKCFVSHTTPLACTLSDMSPFKDDIAAAIGRHRESFDKLGDLDLVKTCESAIQWVKESL